MKIDYHLYHLHAHHSLNTKAKTIRREGALLRIAFGDGSVGYADCHPWPELGDLPLQIQLNRLLQKNPTSLTKCSLRFAQIDAQARKKNYPLLVEKRIPKSHFLVTDFLTWSEEEVKKICQHGYTHLKIKLGRHVDEEAAHLLKLFEQSSLKLKLRFDFNESLTYDSCQHFLDKISTLKPSIDFIEDPFPFHAKQWERVQSEGWILACDRHAVHANQHPKAAEVLVIKPAIQQEAEWKNWTQQRRIVTSYLDHPLGQMGAAFAASMIDPEALDVHGLLSHHAYTSNPFSQKLAEHGPCFKVPCGDGFGFESELAKLQWKALV